MKILLIEPPSVSKYGNQRIFGGNGSNKSDFRKPPLDLMMISGYLRKNGFANDLLDANASRMTISDVEEHLQRSRPDLIVFSTSTCTIRNDVLLAGSAKGIDPNMLTVAVGTHVMALPDETMGECDDLDAVVVSGEWEQGVLNIVNNYSVLERAKGICFRDQNGDIRRTEAQEPIFDVDSLGFPSHDLLDKEIYRDPTLRRFPKTMVMGQKACINNCSFCCQPAFFGAPVVRRRSVDNFLTELQWVQELGFREVMFNDATLTSDKDWAMRLFGGMIDKKIDLTWNCSTRADCIDLETLKAMKRAGCHTIAIGMESVDTNVLKNIRKNIDPEQIKKAIGLMKQVGIDTIVFCVIGFPGENQASINKTISFLKTLPTTYITLGIAVPAPGTDFYKYIEENDYLLTRDWSLFDPMKKPVFSYPDLTSDEIAHYSAHGLRQFYLRPSYIMKRLASIRSASDVAKYAGNFMGFVKRYVVQNKNIFI